MGTKRSGGRGTQVVEIKVNEICISTVALSCTIIDKGFKNGFV